MRSVHITLVFVYIILITGFTVVAVASHHWWVILFALAPRFKITEG